MARGDRRRDIAAAGERHANWLIKELQNYPDEVTRTLATIDKLNPEFVDDVISQLALTEQYKAIAKTAIQRSKEILRATTGDRTSS
jgi:hemoglobin-like flavoprotein